MGLHSLAQFAVFFSVLPWCLSTPELAFPAELGSIELSAYALGSWPRDQDNSNQGAMATSSFEQGFGAGLKAGLFPSVLHGIIGVALDSNIHSGALALSRTMNGQSNEAGSSDWLVTNTTANLILRYPSETIRPYIGIGVGWSTGTLLNPNIAGRNDKDFDSAYALVHQFLGGVQMFLNLKVFLFSEYRYVSSTFHWDRLAVEFRTHYGLVGAGFRF